MTTGIHPTGDRFELLVVDGVAHLAPTVRPDMRGRLPRILEHRWGAAVTGQCPRCQSGIAATPVTDHGGRLVMAHDRRCDVRDEVAGPLIAPTRRGQ